MVDLQEDLRRLEESLDATKPPTTCVNIYLITKEIRDLKQAVKELVGIVREQTGGK